MNLKNSSENYAIRLSHFSICQFFYSKVLIEDPDSKKRVQIVMEFSMELDPKIFNQQ